MDDYQNYIQSGSDNQNTGGGNKYNGSSNGGGGCLTTILSLLVIPLMLAIFAGIASLFK